MNSATEYLGLAALLAMRNLAKTQGLPRNRAEFIQEFIDRYGWKIEEAQAEKALRQVEIWGFVSILSDKYAGESLRFTRLSSDESVVRNVPDEVDELLGRALTGGVAWFQDVFKNQNFWGDLHSDKIPERPTEHESDSIDDLASTDIIPASDRLVTRSDNKQSIDLLSADLRGISEEIRENNDISIELGDEKELIEGEVQAAEILLSQPVFRLQRLYTLILPALRFLADKFASGAIGEMAKRIIALLIGLA